MTAFYFAYGSNMSRLRLEARIGGVKSLGPACLEGFRLVFNKPSNDGSGKANLVEARDARAWGVVWRIGIEHFSKLDGFEPGYERLSVQVRTHAAESLAANVYLHPAVGDDIPPHDWYIDHILAGAREHALPRDWIDALVRIRLTATRAER